MSLPRAECGYCYLEGPDEDGNYDLLESPSCPIHAPAPSAPSGDEHAPLGVSVDDPECRAVPWWQAA